MARKAKEAAQQKIVSWTQAIRRSQPGPKATTTTAAAATSTTQKNIDSNENDENRSPLQSHSQTSINSMQNCSVRLERLSDDTVQLHSPRPTAEKKLASPKPVDENVYDYSFDMDATPLDSGAEMQDLFAKLAKQNRIEVKKYKPKAVRQAKNKANNAGKPKTVRKRRQEKCKTAAEPPTKKPNLNVGENAVRTQLIPVPVDANRNQILRTEAAKVDLVGNVGAPRPQPLGNSNIPRSAHNIERLRNLTNFQPTMKQSTPLKAIQALGSTKDNVENSTTINLAVDSTSPAIVPNSRIALDKGLLTVGGNSTPLATRNNENIDRSIFAVDDFDSMGLVDLDPDPDPEPTPSTSGLNKENSLNVARKSALSLNDSSSFNIYSPTKRRVYGRSPLKNIVSPSR